MKSSPQAPPASGTPVPAFVAGRSGGAVRSYCLAGWGGLKDGVLRVDSTNRPNGMVRVSAFAPRALEMACALLVSRHSVLHCFIEERDGAPWLVPLPRSRPAITVLDHSARSTSAERKETEEAIGNLVWSKFDVTAGPLYRAYAVRFGADEVYIGLVVHHFVADAVSIAILMDEFAKLYDALAQNKRPVLPPVGLRYQDYLLSMSEWIETDAGAALRASAVARLAAIPQLDFGERLTTSPGEQTFFQVDRKAAAEARATARRCGVSLFTLLLAAQNILLRPYASNGHVALKVITTGREAPQLSRVVGNMADRMVVMTDMRGASTVSEVVERTQKGLSAARKHAFVRDEFIRSDTGAKGLSMAAPVFNFQTLRRPATTGAVATSDLSAPSSGVQPTRPRDVYYLVMYDNGEDLWGDIKYGAGEISGFLDQFEQILAGQASTDF